MQPVVLAQAALDGVVVGAMISLAALGLTFIWAIEGFTNIAQGDTLTLGAYAALGVVSLTALPLPLAAVPAVLVTVGVVLVTRHFVYRPLADAPRVTLLVSSIGVAVAYRGAISLLFGTELQSYRQPLQRAMNIGPLRISPTDIAILVTVATLLVVVWALLYRTRMGLEMRAVADLPMLARVSGIESARVLRLTWALSGMLAATGGILLATKLGLTPQLGWSLLLGAFAATVLGSVGNPIGAVVGGLVIGVTTEVSAVLLSPTYKQAVAFVVLAGLLILRPRGLFANR